MKENVVRVLLIEDNPGDGELMRLALARADGQFDVIHAVRLADGLNQLADNSIHAVLADLTLPDSSGLETVMRLRAAAPDVPIIVLTGLASDEIALQSLEQGAQDYLVKDHVTPEVLSRAIRYALQRQKNAEMRRLLETVRKDEKLLARKNRRLARLYKTAHRFVDNVSHEFRTPLTVIKEYTALLREGIAGPVNAEQAGMLDILGVRADDLTTMVDDMLDVSKLEAGLLATWRKKCAVGEIIDYVRPALERKATVKDVSLEVQCPADLPEVFCDAEKIGRVLINLTINAIKFCGEPGQVRIWARPNPDAPEVIVGVTDNGPGMDAGALTVIFKRFKQLQCNVRGSTKGFGLGLNIAKELVGLNFGEMHVESELGKGSTFSFTVPQADPIHLLRRFLQRVGRGKGRAGKIALLRAHVHPAVEPMAAEEVNTFLNWVLRRHDLIVRGGPRHWLLVLPTSSRELPKICERLEKARLETNRNRPRGPLPPIELMTDSIWPRRAAIDEIIRRATLCLEEGETEHAAQHDATPSPQRDAQPVVA